VRRTQAEQVPLSQALRRVTAEPVWATRSSPSFDAAAMDGIAVRAADTVGASESTPAFLDPGAFAVVDTGDPLPEDFDAVVMREHVHHDEAGRAELRGAVADFRESGKLTVAWTERQRAAEKKAPARAAAESCGVLPVSIAAIAMSPR